MIPLVPGLDAIEIAVWWKRRQDSAKLSRLNESLKYCRVADGSLGELASLWEEWR